MNDDESLLYERLYNYAHITRREHANNMPNFEKCIQQPRRICIKLDRCTPRYAKHWTSRTCMADGRHTTRFVPPSTAQHSIRVCERRARVYANVCGLPFGGRGRVRRVFPCNHRLFCVAPRQSSAHWVNALNGPNGQNTGGRQSIGNHLSTHAKQHSFKMHRLFKTNYAGSTRRQRQCKSTQMRVHRSVRITMTNKLCD